MKTDAYPRLVESLDAVRSQWRRTQILEGALLAPILLRGALDRHVIVAVLHD